MSENTQPEWVDRMGRPLRDLRLSVTDRCNFRCRYCLPRESLSESSFLPRGEILDFEEITRVARLFVEHGVQKIRLTGGEPLLRRELPKLVEMLAPLGAELALTTNGVLLERHAEDLKKAGLRRITVSLDALDPVVFQQACDAPKWGPDDVLAGIDAAERAGFEQIKINCAVRRGVNDDQVVPIARRFAVTNHIVRFIEFMDVGTRNEWSAAQVVTAEEIRAQLSEVGELEALPAQYRGEVAQRYAYRSGRGEVGIISSVTEPFCGDCTRARLSADGALYGCLFASSGQPLRPTLRSGVDDEGLSQLISSWWGARSARYSEQRAISPGPERPRLPVVQDRVEMSFIGG